MTDEDFTAVWEGPTLDAQILAARLERASVPFDLDAAPEPGRTRITVPPSYAREAKDAIGDGTVSLVPDSPAELFGPARASSPVLALLRSRIVLASIAVVLVVSIVLMYR